MTKYFSTFNRIQYNNTIMYDITRRSAILNQVFGNRYTFYPYHVKNGMRAEQVADRYYGSPDFVWLVYYSNNIVDPYHQWTKDPDSFNTYIISKYGSMDAARNKIVGYRINWYEDGRKLSVDQYNLLQGFEKKYWTPEFDANNMPLGYKRKRMDYFSNATDADGNITLPVDIEEQSYWIDVSALDIEEEENEKKANIRLLDNRLAQTAAVNLKELMK